MRVTFLGLSCAASAAALAEVIAAGQDVSAVVLADGEGGAPGEVERLAEGAGVPLLRVSSAGEVAAVLRAHETVVAVAACFPWRLPRAARRIPPLGILNIHPSLLPLGRGPEPVFWTLRRGERTTGVTVHRMDAGLDTGPIVAQEEMALPEGVRAPELENQLMALGARLAIESLPALAAGALQPRPQPATGATYAPVPATADWTMSSLLPAAWAWRFARGVAPLGGPLAVLAGGEAIPVADALEWSADERMPQSLADEGAGVVRVRFTPGWVRFVRKSEVGSRESPVVTRERSRPTMGGAVDDAIGSRTCCGGPGRLRELEPDD